MYTGTTTSDSQFYSSLFGYARPRLSSSSIVSAGIRIPSADAPPLVGLSEFDDDADCEIPQKMTSSCIADPISSSPAAMFLSAFSSPKLSPSQPDSEGSVVSGYTLGPVIGYGGFSTIRRAFSASGDVVAVKIVRRSDHFKRGGDSAHAKKRIKHEAEVWASLSHENILPLFTSAHTSYADYFFTLFCPCGSLFDLLKRDGHLPHDDVGTMFRQVVRGLRYLHEVAMLVHRDIKLENVMVDESGVCRIGDFGMSKRIGEPDEDEDEAQDHTTEIYQPHQATVHRAVSLNVPSAKAGLRAISLQAQSARHRNSTSSAHIPPPPKFHPGSLPYAAPELLLPQADAIIPNPAQDIWALGILLHTLLAGHLPFYDPFEPRLQTKILNATYATPPGIGRGAERVLKGCLDRSDDTRWSIAMVDEVAWGVGWGPENDNITPADSDEEFQVPADSRSRSRHRLQDTIPEDPEWQQENPSLGPAHEAASRRSISRIERSRSRAPHTRPSIARSASRPGRAPSPSVNNFNAFGTLARSPSTTRSPSCIRSPSSTRSSYFHDAPISPQASSAFERGRRRQKPSPSPHSPSSSIAAPTTPSDSIGPEPYIDRSTSRGRRRKVEFQTEALSTDEIFVSNELDALEDLLPSLPSTLSLRRGGRGFTGRKGSRSQSKPSYDPMLAHSASRRKLSVETSPDEGISQWSKSLSSAPSEWTALMNFSSHCTQAQAEGLCLRYPENLGLHRDVNPEAAVNMLMRATSMAASVPFAWGFIDKPPEGQLLLLYHHPQSPFPNDGLRFQEQEVKYAMPAGNNRELEVHEVKYGFIPGGQDPNAWRCRRRYRLIKGGNPSLVLVHYTQGPIAPGEKMGQKVYPSGTPMQSSAPAMQQPGMPMNLAQQQAMVAQQNTNMELLEQRRREQERARAQAAAGGRPPRPEEDDSGDEVDHIATRTLALNRYRRNHDMMNEVFKFAAYGDKHTSPPPRPYSIFDKNEIERKTVTIAKLEEEIEALNTSLAERRAARQQDRPDVVMSFGGLLLVSWTNCMHACMNSRDFMLGYQARTMMGTSLSHFEVARLFNKSSLIFSGVVKAILPILAAASSSLAIYVPLREYSGATFFDAWDFYGDVDNTTWGNVTFLDRPSAMAQRLAYIDDTTGHAIIRVDNTTNIAPEEVVNRPSVRLTSQDTYGEGNLILIDVAHIPTGCSVWPSFWTLGIDAVWPGGGEIDIIEGINLMPKNQMALHTTPTTPGCLQAPDVLQSGKTVYTNCSSSDDDGRGCVVQETKTNSFGDGFNAAGGGVFATQIDISGVYMWFWSRPDIPTSISGATPTSNIDSTTFGTPSAAWPATGCNFTEFFTPQQLILLTTLCGEWAGVPNIYAQTCSGTCISNVIGDGSVYNDAWWDVAYVRVYQAATDAPAVPSTLVAATGTSSPQTPTTSSPLTVTSIIVVTNNSTGSQGNGALGVGKELVFHTGLALAAILSFFAGFF
ncbi:hypothetical protein H0H93_016394 [Arthromyces matolae]|nr:hypothetical protein H0H93_016394 [Arthromyces matolae]